MDPYDIPESELAEADALVKDSLNVGAPSPVSDVHAGDTASLLPSRTSFESDSLSPLPPTEVNSEADLNGKVDEDLQSIGAGSPVSDVPAKDTALPFPFRMSFGSDSLPSVPPAEVDSEENEADTNRTMDEDLQSVGAGSPVSDVQAEDTALPFPSGMSDYDSLSPGPPTGVNFEENEADSNDTNLQNNDLPPAFDAESFLESVAKDPKADDDLPVPQFPPPIPSPQDTVPPPVYSSSGSSSDTRVERLGEELSSDSGVWSTYIATAAAFDAEMLDGWNKGLDVLIIFASLFSAVVTAFVIESSKDLQPDYLQINALLMAHTLKALNDPHNSSYLPNLPSPEEILAFEKPLLAKMVNIFWYAALGFSLSGVLITMLAKQWLVSYGSQPQDEPHKTACQRQRRYDSLYRWSVPWMLALLPALLHAALFLFLIGLIIYLWQLDSIVSVITCVILGILGLFYFASCALAAFRSNCPYQTPLSHFIRSFILLRNKHHIQPDISSKDLSSRAAMWLATTNNPKTVSTALQSLAGLRRGFRGYDAEQIHHLAKLALEQLRSCFIPEWRNGDVYTLRTECQYEASCYSRTLMHLVDNPRVDPKMVSSILDDPALPVFIQLLALCSDHSIALLAMCDNQRLLHQIEFRRWNSALSSEGDHDLPTAANMVRSGPSQENMKKIVLKLNDYLKDLFFLHPYAIEIAVETIGFAPLSWTSSVFTKDPPLTDIVKPLVKLLGATRGSFFGVRHATARTFSVLARIHEISRMEDPVADFALRFDSALVIVKELEGVHSSDWQARDMLLSALSHFVVKFEEEEISTVEICEELFYECDKRFGDEMHMFVDEAAVTTLLPLLHINTLKPDLKARIVRSLHDNAISAVQTFSLPDDGTVTPPIAFPPETVSTLLKTLDAFKDSSHSWLRDLSTSIYLVTRSPIHRQHLLAEAEHIISLINSVEQEEIASHLFLILSDSAHKVIMTETESKLLPHLVSAGVLDMLEKYSIKPGLTPADVHMWVTILCLLDSELPDVAKRSVEVREHMHTHFRAQTAERTTELIELQEPLLQFSFQPPSSYTPESALTVLETLSTVGQSVSGIATRQVTGSYTPESALTVLETLSTVGQSVSGIATRQVTGFKEEVDVDPDHEK